MSFIRRFDDMPGVEILTDIEAIDIIDKAGPAAIAGLKMGTVAVIGEFLKGTPNVPIRITSAKQLADTFGTISSESNPGGTYPEQQAIASVGSDTPKAYCSNPEGNAYMAISAATFGGLVLINVDQHVGKITLTQTVPDTSQKLSAGSLIKLTEGGDTYWAALLEDVSFATGATASAVTVRKVSGTVSITTAATGVVNSDSTITVAVDADFVDMDTTLMHSRYISAIDVAKADIDPINEVSMFVATRHEKEIIAELTLVAKDLTDSGRGRLAVIAPPVGTSITDATGDKATHSLSVEALGREDYIIYVYPGIVKPVKELGTLGYNMDITVPGDLDFAALMSQTAPEENPAQPTDKLRYVTSIEAAELPYLSLDQYKAFRAAGVVAPRYDRATGMGYQSGVTSVDPTIYPEKRNIARIRMAYFIEDSVANALQVFNKTIMSNKNTEAAVGETVAFLDGLLKADRIRAYDVDPNSGNTPENEAKGIFVIIISVTTLASMDAIVLYSEIGETVVVKGA